MQSADLLSEIIANFHWQRPMALFVIPIALVLLLALRQGKQQVNRWHQYIDKSLLSYLVIDGEKQASTHWVWWLFAACVIGAVGLAGPAWEKIPQPVHKKDDALVILFDLSPSMMAEDVKPSRLVRARYKLIDLLKQRNEGQTALVAYSGEAHIVSPLTDDIDTIINLLPALSPATMPLQGSNTEMAVRYGIKLLKDSGRDYGNILLVSDGVVGAAVDEINTQLSATSYGFYVLGVGTPDGGPIPSRSGFVKDSSGGIVIAKLNQNELNRLASANGGRYQQLQQSDRDVNNFMSDWESSLSRANNNSKPLGNNGEDGHDADVEREFDQWQDQGFWLVFLLIPLALFGFRRGWILAFLPAVLMLSAIPEPAMAQPSPAPSNPSLPSQTDDKPATSLWQDLWQTRDQQAMEAYEQKDFKRAGELFENNDWRGAAQYHSGEFDSAGKQFSNSASTQSYYNKGNALARAGKLDDAIDAYSEALKSDPNNADAKFNLDLVKKIKEQEQQKQEKEDSKDGDKDQDSEDKEDGKDSKDGDDKKSEQNDQQDQKDQDSQGDDQSEDGKDGEDSKAPEDGKEGDADKDQEQSEENKKDQKPQPGQDEKSAEDKAEEQAQAAKSTDDLSAEERQALEQWLQQVPDDPAGLLRNKFNHQYQERRRAYREGRWQPPENNADKRF